MVKDIGQSCREGEPDYAAELAEAAGNLSLPPPRGKAGVNTQALGRWLAARKDRPGPFVLREGRRYSGKPARWYVEKSVVAAPEPEAGDYGAVKWTGEPIRLRFPDAPAELIPDGDLAAVLPQPDEPIWLTAPVYHPGREGLPVIDEGETTLRKLSAELVEINKSMARNGNRQRNFNLAIGHRFRCKAKPGAGADGSKEGAGRQWRTVEVTWLPWEPDETPDLFDGNGAEP